MKTKNLVKRIVASALTVALVFNVVPMNAFAVETNVVTAKRGETVSFDKLDGFVDDEAVVKVAIDKDGYKTEVDATTSKNIKYYVGNDEANDGVAFSNSGEYTLVKGVGSVTGDLKDEAIYNGLKATAEEKENAVDAAKSEVTTAEAERVGKKLAEEAKELAYNSAVNAYEDAVDEQKEAQKAFDDAEAAWKNGDTSRLEEEIEDKLAEIDKIEGYIDDAFNGLSYLGYSREAIEKCASGESLINDWTHKWGNPCISVMEKVTQYEAELASKRATLEEKQKELENSEEALKQLEADKNTKEAALNEAKAKTAEKEAAIVSPKAEYEAAKAATTAAETAVNEAKVKQTAAETAAKEAEEAVEAYIKALTAEDVTFDPAKVSFTKGDEGVAFNVKVYDVVTVKIVDGAPAGAAVSTSSLKVFDDETAEFTVTPVANYNYEVEGATKVEGENNTYVVGPIEKDTTVTVNYKEFGKSDIVVEKPEFVESIAVMLDSTDVTGKEVHDGKVLKVVATAKDGYAIDKIVVNGKEITGDTFTVNADVVTYTVSATVKFVGATVDYDTSSTDKAGSVTFTVDGKTYNPGEIIVNVPAEVTVNITPATTNPAEKYTINSIAVIADGQKTTVDAEEEGVFKFTVESGKNYAVVVEEDAVSTEDLKSTLTVNIDDTKVDYQVTVDGDGYKWDGIVPGSEVEILLMPYDNNYITKETALSSGLKATVANGQWTYTFVAEPKTEYVLNVTADTILVGNDAEINKYTYLKWINGLTDSAEVKKEIIDKAFTTVLEDDCITVEYNAGNINVETVIKAVIGKYTADLNSIVAGIVNGLVDRIFEYTDDVNIDVWSNVENKEDEIYSSAMEDILEKTGSLNTILNYIGISEAEIKTNIEKYLEAGSDLHTFGANATEEVKASHTCTSCKYGDAADEATITMVDMRTEVDVDVNTEISVIYGDSADEVVIEKLLADRIGVNIDGKEIANHNQLLTLSETLEEKAVGTYTVEVYMNDNSDFEYKDAEKVTVTVTVEKAPANVNVEDLTVKYGDDYNPAPVITNNKGEVIDVDTIEFVVGLDASEFDIDGDTVKGIDGKVQLMLPDSLQDIFDLVGAKDGVSFNLSDFMGILNNDMLKGLLGEQGVPSEMLGVLGQALDSISNIAEAGNIEITIGGSYPENIGAYIHGAVTVDSNYETAFDLGYIVITPDGYKAELGWNQEDENGVITRNAILDGFDFGASVTKAYEGDEKEAQQYLTTFFMGVDTNGEATVTYDPAELKFGVYTQIAMLTNVGNTMYYAEPIVRVFTVAPQIATVEVENSEFVYNTEAHNAEVNVVLHDGSEFDPNGLQVTYVGVDTNGNVYNSTEAPVNTGVYTVYAVYVAKVDGVYEHAGFGTGVIVIKPATPVLTVEDTEVTCNGSEQMPTINNENNLELIKVIVDENNNVNVVLPFEVETKTVNVADATAELKAILTATNKGYAAAETISAKLVEALNKIDLERLAYIAGEDVATFVAELTAEATKASEVLAKYDVDTVAAELVEILNKVNVNEFTVNGTLPTECGVYEVTVVGFGANYKPAKAEGTLTINHARAEAVVENYVDSDCENTGSYDAVVYCAECDEELSRLSVVVTAKGHTPAEAVVENYVAPGCEKTGSYDDVVYCEVCEEELSRTEKSVDATDHAWGNWTETTAPKCEVAGEETRVCDNDSTHKETRPVEAKGHTPGEAATCIAKQTCTECGTELAAKDMNNHVGETELRYARAATATEEGYTGDLYCKSCGNLIKLGEKIPATGSGNEGGTTSGTTSGTTTTTTTTGRTNPNTSDNSMTVFWMYTMVISAATVMALIFFKRKREE